MGQDTDAGFASAEVIYRRTKGRGLVFFLIAERREERRRAAAVAKHLEAIA